MLAFGHLKHETNFLKVDGQNTAAKHCPLLKIKFLEYSTPTVKPIYWKMFKFPQPNNSFWKKTTDKTQHPSWV